MLTERGSDDSQPPHKKTRHHAGERREAPANEDLEVNTTVQQSSIAKVDLVQSAILSPELAHLEKKYDFTTMSIISSAKMEQKTRALLSHLAKFDYADLHCKPGVVALHAKGKVAEKMISIVDIAKREIEHAKGHWWQYSRCHGKLEEWKQQDAKARRHGGNIAETVQGNGKTQEPLLRTGGENGMDVAEVDEEEAAFEAMPSKEIAAQVEARHKVRAVAIMTIYMSRVPIPEFKAIYGEQTNCPKAA